MRIPRALGIAATFATALFWALGVAVPLAALAGRIGSVTQLLDADVLGVAWATARQAWLSAALSAAIGLPLGLGAAAASRRMAGWVDALLLVPQGVPTVVAATAWVGWLGRSGWLAHLELGYSLSAVVLAHVFYNAPWVALLVAQARRQIARAGLEAASTLGAGPWARFRFVVWPELRWALGAAGAQVLALCSMSFALVLILGGGPPVETLETALYARLRGGGLELSGAAACAAWELLLTLGPWALLLALRARAGGAGNASGAGAAGLEGHRRGRGGARSGTGLSWFAGAGAMFFCVPYLTVYAGAAPWLTQEFWSEVAKPLWLSLQIAGMASVSALGAAVFAVVAMQFSPRRIRPLAGTLLALPSGLSVLVLGLGGWFAYGRWIDPFEGSLGAIVALQGVVFFPIAFRALWPLAQSAQRPALEAAWTLGASPAEAFWILEWPRWRAPFFSALALVAGLALGEVAAVSLFYSEHLIPLPLLVSRWMGQYRFEEARAVSALLFTGSAAMMVIVSGWGRGTARGAHAI